MVSKFKETLESGKFVITSEVAPPKGTNTEKLVHHIELLRDKVDAMNVTDHQSSVMRFPSIGGALLVKEMGGEPILQMSPVGRTTSRPVTMSELKPYCCVSLPWPCRAT